ncbi:hypothetical protein NDU88_001188 [Pleurodeles waltl]|uniref:Uncharacterized protein n=1 Tax=Pleurodeles waltl TaxID=8319 RepID=A0AAV7KNW7_PLEWA|nr:hypothetical protein NDU88_001188 [Pleurodeles waltl]
MVGLLLVHGTLVALTSLEVPGTRTIKHFLLDWVPGGAEQTERDLAALQHLLVRGHWWSGLRGGMSVREPALLLVKP